MYCVSNNHYNFIFDLFCICFWKTWITCIDDIVYFKMKFVFLIFKSALICLLTRLSKRCFIRVGSRCKIYFCPIHFDNVDFVWVQEVRYLGVYIVSAKKFIRNTSDIDARQRFFSAFVAIYSRLESVNTSSLLLSLLSTNCTPNL